VWSELTGTVESQLSNNVTFDSIGGNSLLNFTLARKLGLSLHEVIFNRTIAEQALLLKNNDHSSSIQIVPHQENQRIGPTTFQQRQIYIHSKTQNYNYLMFLDFEFKEEDSILKEVNQVLKSIPELRTIINLKEEKLIQIVLEEERSPILERISEEEISEWMKKSEEKIDVEKGPVALIANIIGKKRIIGVIHHTASDGLGMEELRKRICQSDFKERRISYLDYAYWQEEEEKKERKKKEEERHIDSELVEMMIPSVLMKEELVI